MAIRQVFAVHAALAPLWFRLATPAIAHTRLQVKVLCQFRGREMEFKQIAFDLFNRFIRELKDEVTVDSAPSIEGRSMILLLSPQRGDTLKPSAPKAAKPAAAAAATQISSAPRAAVQSSAAPPPAAEPAAAHPPAAASPAAEAPTAAS